MIVLPFVDPDATSRTDTCIIDSKLPYLANQPQNPQMQLESQIQVSSCKESTAHSLHTILVQPKKDTKFATDTYKKTSIPFPALNQVLSHSLILIRPMRTLEAIFFSCQAFLWGAGICRMHGGPVTTVWPLPFNLLAKVRPPGGRPPPVFLSGSLRHASSPTMARW